MTPEEIIKEIRALPAEERAKVAEFIGGLNGAGEVRYASREDAKRAIDEVFVEHRELMRKLSQ